MTIRKAQREDVPAIVRMLADDALGQQRERYNTPLPETYYRAFEQIDQDAHQELIVLEDAQQEVIGTLQLTFIPYLTYQGGLRAQIEAVRIRKDRRQEGLGEQLFRWAIEHATTRQAHVIQLTTDKQRPEARKFYEKLGFTATHEGMKLHLKAV